MEPSNYVAKLNEYSQKTRSQLFYKDLESSGPDHDRTFAQRVVLNGVEYPEGVGKSKKEAKHDAAKNALKRLVENQQDTEDSQTGAGDSTSCSLISERGQKNRAAVKPVDSATGSNNSIIDKTRRLNMNSQDNGFSEANFTGLVNQYCQERNVSCVFAEEGMSGPSHNPQFFYRLVIDNKEYPVGDGRSKKEARQRAAQLAWSALQDQSHWGSELSLMSTSCEDSASVTESNSNESSSRDEPVSNSDSVAFRHSSNQPQDQMSLGSSQGPSTPPSAGSLKPSKKRTSVTSEFVAFKAKQANPAKKQDEEMKLSARKTPTQSRFTAEFDSIEHLGKGGFGCVYRAREKLLNIHYAVKIVAYQEKALREVKALSDLSHQNIVRYYSCWMEDSHCKQETGSLTSDSSLQYLYIKMELCDTKTLRNWIRKRNQTTEQVSKRREDGLTIAQQIVLGVEYIHSKYFIHRDLKPENIMFGHDKAVKIGDFGLVTAEDRADDGHRLKRTKAGTRSYMAPEQKNPQYGHKVDIFALGLIFFELLWKMSTGHEKISTWENVRCQKFPEPFRDSFFEQAQIMKQMLSERPEDRPEASSVKAELEKWTQQHFLLRNVTV